MCRRASSNKSQIFNSEPSFITREQNCCRPTCCHHNITEADADLQIRVCRRCCWWASVCGKRPACSSTARRSTGSPDGCTCPSASPGRPFQRPSSASCGTCSGSRRRQRRPSAWCTWLACPVPTLSLWTAETSACPPEQVHASASDVRKNTGHAAIADCRTWSINTAWSVLKQSENNSWWQITPSLIDGFQLSFRSSERYEMNTANCAVILLGWKTHC